MQFKFSNWFLYFATIVVNLFSFTIGCLVAWNSPVLPKFQSNDPNINPLGAPITTVEVSIGASIVPIASAIGTLLGGKLGETFGRRKSMIIFASGAVVSLSAMFFVRHIYVYFAILTATSVCIASAFVLVPIYVTEIAEDGNRGMFGCFLSVSIMCGQLYGYVLGPITSLGVFALLCALPSMLFLVFCMYLPESPIFLALKGDKTAALIALQTVRRNKRITELDFEYTEKEKMLKDTAKEESGAINILFKTRAGRKALLLSLGLRLTQQLSGMFVILSFLGPLFGETGSHLSPEVLTVIVSVINIAFAILALNIIEKKGRRLLLLPACFFCGLSTFVLGLYFVFKEHHFILPASVKLIPVLCLFTFICMFTFGLSNVPFIVISEILPNEVRSVGSSIVLVTGNITAFMIAFAFPLVSEYLGTYTCMFAFSFFCYTGFAFMYFFLPETKGKSFLEIQNEFEK